MTPTPPQLMAPREYQTEAIEAIAKAWRRGIAMPAIEMACGLGKTVIFSWIGRYWHEAGNDDHAAGVLVLVHRDELVRQAVSKYHDVAPALTVGVIKAQVKQTRADVIVASVQTLARNERLCRELAARTGLVIVDECHHATAPSYRKILKWMGCEDGSTLGLGVTATMMRADKAALGDVFGEIVYTRGVLWGIQNGYLADIKGYGITAADFDMSKVRVTAGDFNEGQLGEALSNSHAFEIGAAKWNEYARDLPGLIFTPTVDTAYQAAEVHCAAGIETRVITGAMAAVERRAVLAEFEAGEIQAIANCAVLTEGTDLPRATVCALYRPTKSASLFMQIVGRVLRPYPGKDNAVLLDLVAASARHKLASLGTLAGAEVYETESLEEAAERIEAQDAELAEAQAEEDASATLLTPAMITLEASEDRVLDLFGSSRQQWLRTRAGYWFLSTRSEIVAIVPADGSSWNVGYYGRRGGGGLITSNVTMPDAMLAGERYVSTQGTVTGKSARWRAGQPTAAQVAECKKLGIAIPPLSDAGEIGDLISVHNASGIIDPRLRAWLASR